MSNPSAMSQELSEEKLINRLRDADSILRFGTAVNSGDNRFAHISNANAKLVLEVVNAALIALLSAQRKNEELVRALPLIIDARERAAQLVDFLDDMIEPLELSGADEQGYAARWGRYHSANQALTDAIRSISEEK